MEMIFFLNPFLMLIGNGELLPWQFVLDCIRHQGMTSFDSEIERIPIPRRNCNLQFKRIQNLQEFARE